MVVRETTPELINRITNHPSVRPFIDYSGRAEPMDFSPAVDRAALTGIVWLSNGDDALSCFVLHDERMWEGHIMFADTCRGRRALDTAREMIGHMAPYADLIFGSTPINNRAARWFVRKLGFKVIGHTDEPPQGPCETVALVPQVVH